MSLRTWKIRLDNRIDFHDVIANLEIKTWYEKNRFQDVIANLQ